MRILIAFIVGSYVYGAIVIFALIDEPISDTWPALLLAPVACLYALYLLVAVALSSGSEGLAYGMQQAWLMAGTMVASYMLCWWCGVRCGGA